MFRVPMLKIRQRKIRPGKIQAAPGNPPGSLGYVDNNLANTERRQTFSRINNEQQ